MIDHDDRSLLEILGAKMGDGDKLAAWIASSPAPTALGSTQRSHSHSFGSNRQRKTSKEERENRPALRWSNTTPTRLFPALSHQDSVMAQVMLEDSLWLDRHHGGAGRNGIMRAVHITGFPVEIDGHSPANVAPVPVEVTRRDTGNGPELDMPCDTNIEDGMIAEFTDYSGQPSAAQSTFSLLSRVLEVQDSCDEYKVPPCHETRGLTSVTFSPSQRMDFVPSTGDSLLLRTPLDESPILQRQ